MVVFHKEGDSLYWVLSDEWVLAEVGWGEKGDVRDKASANSPLQKSVVGNCKPFRASDYGVCV